MLAWEDIHWADEGTLDLIDYLSRWLRAPVLQVCLARDELLGRRPGWSTMRRTATVTFLEPLPPEDAQALIRELLRASGAISEQASALAERCGGNPLFAEEMVQRIAEEGGPTHGRAARHRAGPAGGPPGRAGAVRAPARLARGGARQDLLGERPGAGGGGRRRAS